ncbi:MAG: alpha/beta hydrolase [Candidatus Hermodarchaeota archaeon]|nr:alpha/beta hydrolase [Candidatus Hermodarchaeota archaeon]
MEKKEKRELPEFGHYSDVNGLHMYYEDRGKGTPLILLHGGLGTVELGWAELREIFSQKFRVIAPDCRGSGRTNNPQKVLNYALMADDIVALVRALDVEKPIICGWSDGGQIAMEIGIRYRELPKALVLGGATHRLSKHTSDALSAVRDWLQSDPELEESLRNAHGQVYGPMYLETLLELLLQMWGDPTGYPNEAIKSIEAPSLLIIGDKDEAMPLEIQLEMYNLIPNAELAIIPNMTHMNYVTERSTIFSTIVLDFLKRIS